MTGRCVVVVVNRDVGDGGVTDRKEVRKQGPKKETETIKSVETEGRGVLYKRGTPDETTRATTTTGGRVGVM